MSTNVYVLYVLGIVKLEALSCSHRDVNNLIMKGTQFPGKGPKSKRSIYSVHVRRYFRQSIGGSWRSIVGGQCRRPVEPSKNGGGSSLLLR